MLQECFEINESHSFLYIYSYFVALKCVIFPILYPLGKLQEAEDMYRRSLACNEEVLGINHVETLSNVVLIAGIRAECRDYRGAQTLYNRARMGYETAVGPLHSSTIDTVHYIGEMLLLQQKPTAALELLHKAYEERLAYYGALHPSTLATLFCIGTFNFCCVE